jgi:DNA-binding transcriptional LysR family regulator
VLDVAILVSTRPEQRVSHVQVLSEPLSLVGRSDAPVLRQASIRFTELESLPIVMPSHNSGLHSILTHRASGAGLRLAPYMECGSVDLAKQFLRDGGMFCLMPERTFREEVDRGELVAIPVVEPELAMPIYWAVKPDWRLPRALYNELERLIFEEWHETVACGDWPARWVLDADAPPARSG